MHTAIIELDPLPDTVRTATEDHHAFFVIRSRFVLVSVG